MSITLGQESDIEADIAELQGLLGAATDGPWMWASDWDRAAVLRASHPHVRVVCSGNQNNEGHYAECRWSGALWTDAKLIAAMRNMTPRLLTERIALQERVKALEAELEKCAKDSDRLDLIAEEYLKLDCFDMPTGEGDADVGWQVSRYFQAQPSERVIAEIYHDNPRDALDEAWKLMNEDAAIAQEQT